MDLVEILSFLFQLSFSTLGRVSVHSKYPNSLIKTVTHYKCVKAANVLYIPKIYRMINIFFSLIFAYF